MNKALTKYRDQIESLQKVHDIARHSSQEYLYVDFCTQFKRLSIHFALNH